MNTQTKRVLMAISAVMFGMGMGMGMGVAIGPTFQSVAAIFLVVASLALFLASW
jgi:uncharacterized spore protein YtfJ